MSIEKTSPIPFSTHRYVKQLVDAGMPAKQAEILADERAYAIGTDLSTKQDVEMVRKDMEIGLAEVRREIEQAKVELMKFMMKLVLSAMGVQTAAITVIMAVLIRFLA